LKGSPHAKIRITSQGILLEKIGTTSQGTPHAKIEITRGTIHPLTVETILQEKEQRTNATSVDSKVTMPLNATIKAAQGILSHQTERIPTTKGQKLTQSKTMSRVTVKNTVT
jgi:hypothetical protein